MTSRSKPHVVGGDDDTALLSMPREPTRTEEERRKAEEELARQDRAAAVQVCSQAIREGCEGPGCPGPEHVAHAWQALEDLRALGLAEDPFTDNSRYHFGKAAPRGGAA